MQEPSLAQRHSDALDKADDARKYGPHVAQDLAAHLERQVPAKVRVVMVECLEISYETVNTEGEPVTQHDIIPATRAAVEGWLNP